MGLSVTIPAENRSYVKSTGAFIIMILLALIIGTFLRVSLLVSYPVIVLFIIVFFRFRISPSFFILLSVAVISFLLSLFEAVFLKYKLLSFYYMLPFLLLLFSNPPLLGSASKNYLSIFIMSITIVAVLNDIVGFVQVFRNPNSDDSFVGLYSEYSLSINGLMLINCVLFFYYFLMFINFRKLIYLLPSIFFLLCAVMGYYGAGLIIFMAAFVLSFFRFSIAALLRTFAITIVTFLLVFVFMYTFKPIVLEYNIANIKKLMSFDPKTGARKVTSFYNYGISYPRNAKDFLFGSGPGTFVSRSAFMVGSPSYFQKLAFIKDDRQPYYFKNYAYTLWNANNTQKELYLDGFRNQPFSSILAFLGEYGLIFTLFFFLLYLLYYRKVADIYYHASKNKAISVNFRFFKFLIILLPLLLLIDNYFEYPEVMLLVILGMKFAHAEIHKLKLQQA
jgi:hypothetical protein